MSFIDNGYSKRARNLLLGDLGIVEAASTWNTSLTVGDWSFSNADRTATWITSGFGVNQISGTVGRTSGKRYFEIVKVISGTYGPFVRDSYGICRLPYAGDPGADGCVYRRGGQIIALGSPIPPSVFQLADGDIVGVAFDLDTGNLWLARNNVWVIGDPALGTSPVFTMPAFTYFPGASSETPSPAVLTLNSRYAEFVYSVPAGFISWAQE